MAASFSKQEIAKSEWFKHWAGGWSLLSCTYFGDQYTRSIEEILGVRLHHAVFVHHKGYGAAFLRRDEMDKFGGELAQKVLENDGTVLKWCEALKEQTDSILGVISRLEGKQPDWKNFSAFTKALYDYIPPHLAVKKVVDYLPAQTLEKHLHELQEARLYAEKVYTRSEEFVVQFSQKVAEKEKIEGELVRCMTKQELEEYFEKAILPEKKILEERFGQSALLYENGKYELVCGKEVEEIEKALLSSAGQAGVLKGMAAFAGKATGIARIVLNPLKDGSKFKQGEVLVTGMTRPEYLPLMKKAAAVVTDAGGVLSHAAISAREMKIVCVIGTQKATKTFKDGDLLEVDAEKGIVRKIG